MNEQPDNSSGQIYDSSSNTNNGTTYNMDSADSISGQIGNAIDFDGSNDYILVADDNSLDGMSQLTISFWMNKPSTATDGLIDKNRSAEWNMHTSGGNMKFEGQTPADVTHTTSSSYTTGSWTHICQTYDGSTGKYIYFDGSSQPLTINNSGTGNISSSTNPVYIGRMHDGYYTDANFDEVRLATSARSSAWVTTEYNNQNDPDGFWNIGSQEEQSIRKHLFFSP